MHSHTHNYTVFLAKQIDPSNLHGNLIKIGGFTLAGVLEDDNTPYVHGGVGTYLYMAPEVITSMKVFKGSDVWRYNIVTLISLYM